MAVNIDKKEVGNRNTDNAIYFNFSYAALKLLGKNLYNNAANAISELVANGLDAKAKNVYVYIDMSDKEHSIIEIIDDGIGMSDDFVKKLFTPFAQEHRQQTIPSTGLGLVITKGLVELLDGRKVLFPAIPSCILDVDLEKGIMTVHVMAGLID